ncbi:MAG: hypothetical protein ACKPKO_24510 [Candidatus Fonsibacter sp.]
MIYDPVFPVHVIYLPFTVEPVIVPADAVMFPDVLIDPLALKVVPALIDPSDEIFPF